MQVGRFHDCYEIQPAGCTLALWLKASEGASVAAFSISLPRLGLWSAARISPDIVSSHDLAAPFPPSGLRRAMAIALTTTAIVVQWTQLVCEDLAGSRPTIMGRTTKTSQVKVAGGKPSYATKSRAAATL